MQHAILTISGMTCGGCVNSVTRVLKELPGISEIEVTLLPSQAKVSFEANQINVEAMSKAIQEAGFTVTGVTQDA